MNHAYLSLSCGGSSTKPLDLPPLVKRCCADCRCLWGENFLPTTSHSERSEESSESTLHRLSHHPLDSSLHPLSRTPFRMTRRFCGIVITTPSAPLGAGCVPAGNAVEGSAVRLLRFAMCVIRMGDPSNRRFLDSLRSLGMTRYVCCAESSPRRPRCFDANRMTKVWMRAGLATAPVRRLTESIPPSGPR